MAITYNEQERSFTLSNGRIQYVMKLFHDGYLGHMYFGKALKHFNIERAFYQTEREGAPNPEALADARTFSLDVLPQEYGLYGSGDYRIPALTAVLSNGTSTLDLRYQSHEIFKGKKGIAGLPAAFVKKEDEADTLEIPL